MAQRTIKFRAWHKGYPKTGHIPATNPVMLYDESPGDCLIYQKQGQPVEIMQFTGLTDKNGKEIYEGDVLLWDQNYLFKVEYEVCQFIGQAWDGNNTAGYLSFHHFTNSEIIGNIYEHPELLNS